MARNKEDRELLQRYLPELSLTNDKVENIENKTKFRRRSKKRKKERDSDIDRKSGKKSRRESHDKIRRKIFAVTFKMENA